MSRDLVTFNRTERDRQNKDAVERLCTDMGCSEPVARNFLKYKKFGIGPLADFGAERARRHREKQRDSTEDQEGGDILQKMRRVNDLEKRLREQKEQEEREEQEFLEEMKKKRQAKRAGLKPLGPVMAREEAVDPLQKVATPEEREPEEPQAPPEPEGSGQWQSVPRVSADWKKEEEEKKRKLQEQQHHKHHKKKKKRRRDDEEKSEESEHAVKKRARSRSRSAHVEEERKSSSTAAGLMTEKEVLAMMGKEKAKEKPQRGSMQARLRIQREMQEWNSTKAENEEFWKAPRFALCYSAETSRTLRGNTGPNLADAHRKAAEHK